MFCIIDQQIAQCGVAGHVYYNFKMLTAYMSKTVASLLSIHTLVIMGFRDKNFQVVMLYVLRNRYSKI
jgi:hypothetical protein